MDESSKFSSIVSSYSGILLGFGIVFLCLDYLMSIIQDSKSGDICGAVTELI